MREFQIFNPDVEGEGKLLDAANYLLNALSSKKKLSKDAQKVLASLASELSSSLQVNDETDEETDEIEARLDVIHEKIMFWESNQSMIWDTGLNEATEYLNCVDESRSLIERLEISGSSKNDEGLLRKAYDVLQTAMVRLEDEFKHMLLQNQLPFETEHTSFRSNEEDDLSVNSFSIDSVEEFIHHDSLSQTLGEVIVDLVHSDAIPKLKRIANAMFNASYGQECVHAYIAVRKDAISEFLSGSDGEKLSIEDVMKTEWSVLQSKIKKWVRLIRKFVRVYLASEKWLGEQILGDEASHGFSSFIDLSKGSMLQLLNFGEAVALGARQPEKLFRILDMYEVLAEVAAEVETLYADEAGLTVLTEFQHVMRRLGDCVRATLIEFRKAIESNVSTAPFPGGGVHPLTNYVMNYLRLLTDYSQTVDSMLKDQDDIDNLIPNSPGTSPGISPGGEKEESNNPFSGKFTEMTLYYDSITRVLEANLLEKSRLYRDASLQFFFLMNNVYYMAQKVKNSELKGFFEEKWIKKRTWTFQQYAMDYERATWNPILSLFKDEPSTGGSSSNCRSNSLRDRFHSFYAAFEDVYKTQTGWQITDEQLREDLRISASLKVIQAYRMFHSRHRNSVSDRHIKYNADDLEKFLLDLFGGSQRSLGSSHRR